MSSARPLLIDAYVCRWYKIHVDGDKGYKRIQVDNLYQGYMYPDANAVLACIDHTTDRLAIEERDDLSA